MARSRCHLVGGREVPLADGEAREPVLTEDLGQEPVGLRHRRVVAREAGRELDDAAHAARVMVASREEAGAGGRAQRRRVEVAVTQATGREAVEGRRRDVRAVATELRVADVVEKDHDDVRGAFRCRRNRRPPSCRLGQRSACDSLERIWLHVQTPCRRHRQCNEAPLRTWLVQLQCGSTNTLEPPKRASVGSGGPVRALAPRRPRRRRARTASSATARAARRRSMRGRRTSCCTSRSSRCTPRTAWRRSASRSWRRSTPA